MNVGHLSNSAFCLHLTLALLHFVWQGALIAGGSVLAVGFLGRVRWNPPPTIAGCCVDHVCRRHNSRNDRDEAVWGIWTT